MNVEDYYDLGFSAGVEITSQFGSIKGWSQNEIAGLIHGLVDGMTATLKDDDESSIEPSDLTEHEQAILNLLSAMLRQSNKELGEATQHLKTTLDRLDEEDKVRAKGQR